MMKNGYNIPKNDLSGFLIAPDIFATQVFQQLSRPMSQNFNILEHLRQRDAYKVYAAIVDDITESNASTHERPKNTGGKCKIATEGDRFPMPPATLFDICHGKLMGPAK
ncbi:hypothetical protein [Agrobacterium sp. T29]|uniref:hypothetical protein n=1 Tax=Agrobacterium sp. T29 TaxID=2580515 RepID=UPI00115DB1D2|nr:hypothetical protein [Agrobacterium sp. T29]